ncbi:hypothetical protein EYC80_009560 [Monilinia laxa]|uniref:LAGLIDADG endonuclease n=1 Tax=Monilinia laxa TaxID=61186 RepID=A0A5N6JYL8_MONLA|nr:hypothetical protein EYC80_009560 [Monilinia laxa]
MAFWTWGRCTLCCISGVSYELLRGGDYTMKLLLGGIHCSFTAKAIERVFCGIGSMSFENEQNMCKTRFSGQYLYLEYRIIIQSRDVPSIDPYTFLITPDDL